MDPALIDVVGEAGDLVETRSGKGRKGSVLGRFLGRLGSSFFGSLLGRSLDGFLCRRFGDLCGRGRFFLHDLLLGRFLRCWSLFFCLFRAFFSCFGRRGLFLCHGFPRGSRGHATGQGEFEFFSEMEILVK